MFGKQTCGKGTTLLEGVCEIVISCLVGRQASDQRKHGNLIKCIENQVDYIKNASPGQPGSQ